MLPDRKRLLDAMKRSGGVSARSLATLLGVTKREMTAFKRLLRELKREEVVVRGGRGRLELRRPPISGEFMETGRGFGFVRPRAGGSDIFIPKWLRAGARDGDTVEVDLTHPERTAGKVMRVTERLATTLGIVSRRGPACWLLPFRRTMEEVELTQGPAGELDGRVVRVALDYARGERTARVVEVLGHVDDEGIEERIVLETHRRPVDFSDEARAQAASYTEKIPTSEIRRRKDFRELLCFTIDPDDAKDFDDAVSLQPGRSADTWILGVHIADVSYFVAEGSPLDRDAASRGCSVYFPRGVVPMLPPRLSDDLCSLRAGVDRLAFSVMMEVDRRGEVIGAEFYPSVIRSAARLTYTEANRMIEERSGSPAILDALLGMKELSERMCDLRRQRGSLDFDLPEPLLHFDMAGELVHISPYPRLSTHRLVEEFMLAANEAVADHLYASNTQVLYRAHEPPEAEKVEELNDILEIFRVPAIQLPDPEPRDFQRAIENAQDRPEEKFLTYRILRALMLARYTPLNLGHFGLAKTSYLHFTSPIRRYPDLVAHRALRAAVSAAEPSKGTDLEALGTAVSRLERDAEEIEREIVAWKVARFMRKRLGETYDATVIGFSAHHLIVDLQGLYVEGKVRVDSMPGRWELDPGSFVLKSGRKRIKIGDRVKVQVVAVDMRRQETIFQLTQER
ncbi:MAG: VacB/RNase II family 3'-5' exoribonuclease [Acidobacteriota bacterium]